MWRPRPPQNDLPPSKKGKARSVGVGTHRVLGQGARRTPRPDLFQSASCPRQGLLTPRHTAPRREHDTALVDCENTSNPDSPRCVRWKSQSSGHTFSRLSPRPADRLRVVQASVGHSSPLGGWSQVNLVGERRASKCLRCTAELPFSDQGRQGTSAYV